MDSWKSQTLDSVKKVRQFRTLTVHHLTGLLSFTTYLWLYNLTDLWNVSISNFPMIMIYFAHIKFFLFRKCPYKNVYFILYLFSIIKPKFKKKKNVITLTLEFFGQHVAIHLPQSWQVWAMEIEPLLFVGLLSFWLPRCWQMTTTLVQWIGGGWVSLSTRCLWERLLAFFTFLVG